MFLLAQSNLTVHQQTSYQTSCRKYKIQDLRRVAINALNFRKKSQETWQVWHNGWTFLTLTYLSNKQLSFLYVLFTRSWMLYIYILRPFHSSPIGWRLTLIKVFFMINVNYKRYEPTKMIFTSARKTILENNFFFDFQQFIIWWCIK